MRQFIKISSILIGIYAAWLFILYAFYGYLDGGLAGLALIGLICTLVIIYACREIAWRVRNGVDVFATLETDPEVVRQRMLYIMRHGNANGIRGVLKELSDIFRNYPQWELQKWEVFRAWYKHLIDYAVENPDIYTLTFKDGSSPYSKERDPLYDPDAPDWDLLDQEYVNIAYHDDDDD